MPLTRRKKKQLPTEIRVLPAPGKTPKVDPSKLKRAPVPDLKTKLHVIKIPAAEAGTTPEEPTWDSNAVVNDQIALGKALNWYNYAMDEKHYRKCVEEWIRGTRSTTEADKTIKKLDRVPDKLIHWQRTKVALMRMHMRGFPLSVFHHTLLTTCLNDLLENQAQESTTSDSPEKKDVISVQDRIRNQIRPVLTELDGLSDALLDGEETDSDTVKQILHNPDFKAPHYRMIGEYLEKSLREWNKALLAKKGDPEVDTEEADLAEGYRLTTLRQLKNAIATFSDFNLEVRGSVEAVKTPRKKRLRSPEKIVGKLKFKSEDKDLGIQSIDPKDLLGTTTAYLYNAKRRKLTRLVGEFAGSIDVKRSTILGVNLKASATKTLRKPEEQLKELLGLRKGGGDKWFDSIKAKPRAARARTNIETLIIRAD